MLRLTSCLLSAIIFFQASAQQLGKLTVEKIMRDPNWIGSSPSNIQWSNDGKSIYFNWNPEKNLSDSLYYITLNNKTPTKATPAEIQSFRATGNYTYNSSRSAYVFAKNGDIFYVELKTGKTKRITQTADAETNPQFSFNDTKVAYTRTPNLFLWDIATGETMQLVNLQTGNPPSRVSSAPLGQQEDWLKTDQLTHFEVLKTRKEKRDKAEAYNKTLPKAKELRSIYLEEKTLQGLGISPDGRFINYRLFKAAGGKPTIVPSYVTETGFTTDIAARTKVGTLPGSSEFFIYDRDRDTVYAIKVDSTFPGIRDMPDYANDYPKILEQKTKKPSNRTVTFNSIVWSPRGANAVVEIRSTDNKDRWLMLWDTVTHKLKLLDRQRDEAWIGGPGIGFGRNIGWIDENTVWFQSEATGYSHLYTINISTNERKALTTGKYEVQQAQLSRDNRSFYIITNEVHPGEQHFYRLSIADGKKERITTMTGANQVTVSPDEKYLAVLYSYSTKPWELYLQENKPGGKIEQITNKAQSDEFRSYAWREPELITFTASDGAQVYARVYKPANPHPNKPAVLFVHGAGYLQNAHKWWSSYFREYMFNNMLADNGYYVMDIDYRGSAGYGRDWRTGIYRFMGGKDLSDHVDAANYLVKTYGVDPKHIGLYGGSYGGFITLMGMFNNPDVFAAGAALRPVTDWANYNHGYTSNILNEPFNDSLAYRKSSPFYYADGLKGHLLICHGMVDVNV
ncbi:MAG TPA: prolyl oligopeptidase family serine peptidase, partial [Chitinophagaceae bacterium]